jgi:hypothetical protein
MSYEGYYQVICKNGHAENVDCYDFNKELHKCNVCGSAIVWSNLVNVTNGSWDEEGNRIDGFIELELDKGYKDKWCECSKCKNKHLISTPTYRIPT